MRTPKALKLVIGISLMSLAACNGKNADSNPVDSSGNKMLQSMDRAMKADEYALMSSANGGLIGSLYVQPRASMSAPDTAVVGCDQRGNGALGLDPYLQQQSWITQDVLLNEIFVPMRDFRLGFDVPSASGEFQTVRSYFAVQAEGYFQLDSEDLDGDYQFALIADDSARLRTGDRLLIDNEKPAGFNTNNCLDKTQPAHMSCTDNWSDQSASKIQIVNLKRGDKLPIQFEYWQGPGQGIAMMGFYRKVPSAGVADAYCGQEPGFQENSASLNQILTRWKPIRLQNLGNFRAQ